MGSLDPMGTPGDDACETDANPPPTRVKETFYPCWSVEIEVVGGDYDAADERAAEELIGALMRREVDFDAR